LLLADAGIAQIVDGNALPHALKNLKQATGKCVPDGNGVGGGGSADESVAPDLGCMTSATKVFDMMAESGTIIADLRSASDFAAFHIDGALSLTIAELRAKPYWRDKPVVLVGNGKAETELYRECGRLKKIGYHRLHVLHGGMPSWLGQRLPMVGQAPAVTQLVRLSASDLWGESHNGQGLVLLDSTHAALQRDMPGSQVLRQITASELQAALSRSKTKKKASPLIGLVAVSQSTLTDDQIRELQQAVAPLPLLVYADTQEAFRRAMATQKAIWNAQARGPKRPGCGL
jgi:rhodanese-related sulfurtransferase